MSKITESVTTALSKIIPIDSYSEIHESRAKNSVSPPSILNEKDAESFKTGVILAARNLLETGNLLHFADVCPAISRCYEEDKLHAQDSKHQVREEQLIADRDLDKLRREADKLFTIELEHANNLLRNKQKKIVLFIAEGSLLAFTVWGILGLSNYPSLSFVPIEDWGIFVFGNAVILAILFFQTGNIIINSVIRLILALALVSVRIFFLATNDQLYTPYGIMTSIISCIILVLVYFMYVIDGENENDKKAIKQISLQEKNSAYYRAAIARQEKVVNSLQEQHKIIDAAIDRPREIERVWSHEVNKAADQIGKIKAHSNRHAKNADLFGRSSMILNTHSDISSEG
jgi:hypothetical protein